MTLYCFPKCPNLREISLPDFRRHFRDAIQGYRDATVRLQRQKRAGGSSPAPEERLRIISRDTDCGKTLYRCPICPDSDETEIKSQVILHARSFVGVAEQHAKLIRDAEEDAMGEEEDAKDEEEQAEEEHAKDEKEDHAEEEEHAKDEKEEHAEDEDEEQAEDEKDGKEEHAEEEEEAVLLEEDASQACE